jgi:hypothetical protein
MGRSAAGHSSSFSTPVGTLAQLLPREPQFKIAAMRRPFSAQEYLETLLHGCCMSFDSHGARPNGLPLLFAALVALISLWVG